MMPAATRREWRFARPAGVNCNPFAALELAVNLTTIAFGCVPLLFALFTLVARVRHPHMFAKLAPMQQRFGKRLGTALHIIAYSLVPLAFGLTVIHAGVRGVSIAQWMAG